MSRRTSDTEMEADIEIEPDRSRLGAFLRGTALALLACAAAVVAISLTVPLPEDLPRAGRVEVVGTTPAPDTATPDEPDAAATDTAAPEAAPTESAAPDAAPTDPAGSEAALPDAVPTGSAATGAGPAAPETAVPADAASGPSATPASDGSAGAAPDAPAQDAPQAGSGPADPDAAGSGDPVSGSPSPAVSGALAENARAFDAPGDAPLMAVVLVGAAVEALTPERLSLLTMPLNVAIPADAADPLGLAAAARESGHEVMIDVGLSGDAAEPPAPALDLAVAATATDAGAAGAEALGPLLDALAPRGLAWVDTGAGFGTPAERLARNRGMAYTQGNRAVAGDASPEQLYRAIDSAAQQARQWGTSVLLLEATEPALQALIRWGLEQRGDSAVWFAPISAVIARREVR